MPHTAAGTSPDTSSSGPHTGAVIARQAIVNTEQVVVAHELFNRSRPAAEHTAATDVLLIFNALSHAGTEDLVGKKPIFVNCTYDSLAGGHLELLDPRKFVLEIPPPTTETPEEVALRIPIMAELRQRGFRLALSHRVLEAPFIAALPMADYLKFDLSQLSHEQLGALVHQAQSSSQAQLIAEKVETAAQFQEAVQLGFPLFQGYWFARPALIETRLVHPSQHSIIELVNKLRKQASTDEIEEVLKKDAGLAFNLMRLINSAGFGARHEITSVRQAVMLMGLKKLFRWAALLMTTSRATGTPSSVGQTAVVRGRLMELLALETHSAPDADQAFVVGVFSLLDAMLSLPMESALHLLNLPDTIVAALLRREGWLGQLLALAEACESSDDALFEQAANALNLSSQQINLAHLQALAWADQIAD